MHCWIESLTQWSCERKSWRQLAAVMHNGSLLFLADLQRGDLAAGCCSAFCYQSQTRRRTQ